MTFSPMTLMENKHTFVSFRKYTVHPFFPPFCCVIKMTNDTHLRTRDIFAWSLKHAFMYSISYKHAISACMNYVYRQKLHTSGLLDCFHVAFSLVLLQQKIIRDEEIIRIRIGIKITTGIRIRVVL